MATKIFALGNADRAVDHDASTFDHRSILSTAPYADGNDLLREFLPLQKDKESNTGESVERFTEESASFLLRKTTKDFSSSLLFCCLQMQGPKDSAHAVGITATIATTIASAFPVSSEQAGRLRIHGRRSNHLCRRSRFVCPFALLKVPHMHAVVPRATFKPDDELLIPA